MLRGEGFSVSFSNLEGSAWGGLALFEQMLDSMELRQAATKWGLPEPKSNRGDAPLQLIEQFIVSIGCGACRFAHAETLRTDSTLVRLFGWTKAAGNKAIMRLFARFDIPTNERVRAEVYRWFFGKISALEQVTLDVDSTVITRNGEQQGAARGDNPNRQGRASHHSLLAFVADAGMVAHFWLRPGNAHSAHNLLQFLESTLHHLGDTRVGLLRADRGLLNEAILAALEGKRIPHIVAARLTQPLQRLIDQATGWWALEPGLEWTELGDQANGWPTARRLIVVRSSVKRKASPGKTLSLFADHRDL